MDLVTSSKRINFINTDKIKKPVPSTTEKLPTKTAPSPEKKSDKNINKTPEQLSKNAPDSEWEKLFPGFSRLSDDNKTIFKKQMSEMDKTSWTMWTTPLKELNGLSRSQSYTLPMNCKDNDQTSLNFGQHRKKTKKSGPRSHAGLDIYGNGGFSNREGNAEVRAATSGTVVFVGKTGYVPGTEAQHVQIISDDGALINYGEIVPTNLKPGMRVSSGQVLGRTAKLKNQSMLHIEIYEGSQRNEAGQKTIAEAKKTVEENYRKNPNGYVEGYNFITNKKEFPSYTADNRTNEQPFNRPKDLLNPTPFAALACSR